MGLGTKRVEGVKRLKNAFEQGHVVLNLDASNIESAIRQTVQRMVDLGIVEAQHSDEVAEALIQRESEAPTAIGHAAAIPHAYVDGIHQPAVVFVRLDHALTAHGLRSTAIEDFAVPGSDHRGFVVTVG